MSLLVIEDLVRTYGRAGAAVAALKGVSFSVEPA